MAVIYQDHWTPTVAAPTRSLQTGAGVSGRSSVQVTNNTSWRLFIVEGGTAPGTDPGSAKYVVPPRSTAILPLQASTISYRWTAAVAGPADLISSVFSDDEVAPQIIPGVNAQGFDSVTGYSGSNLDAFRVTLADANGFSVGAVTQPLGAFTNALLVENPLPVPVSVKRPAGAAKDTVAIVPARSSQTINLGDTSVVLQAVTVGVEPLSSLAVVRVWPLAQVQPWTEPRVSFPYTTEPPEPSLQVRQAFTIAGMVVGTRQVLYTLAVGELFVLRRIMFTVVLQGAAGGFSQLNYDIELSTAISGAGASTVISTQSATCVASGAATLVHTPVDGPLIVGGGAAGNIIRINPTGLAFIAGVALYGTLEGWKVPINSLV